jgi:uncharacterized phage protein gp47/JayE
MKIKSYDEIYNDMRNYIIAHHDGLTDYNDGGVLNSQIEATAREMAAAYVSCRVGFATGLRMLPYSVFKFAKKEGEKAAVDVVFSRSKPVSYDTNIPAGTIVSTGGLNFLTTETGTILSGDTDSAPIAASAEERGDKYNVSACTITTISSLLPSDVVQVNNPAPATGGENSEDWANYAYRFSDYILGLQRTNNVGFKSGLVNLARSVGIKEHFPPLEGLWNVTLYLEDGSGGMTNDDLAKAKRIIDGNINNNVDGFRAPGIKIQYKTPEIIPIRLGVTLKLKKDINDNNTKNQEDIKSEVKDILRKYINEREIGESVQIDNLTVLLKRFSDLSNVKITLPAEDIIIQESQIARFHSVNIAVVAE